jgi:hypothetical protein
MMTHIAQPSMTDATARLIIAASEQDANLYYATRFLAPDPFVFLQINGRTMLVMSDLEVDRARQQARVDEVLSASKLQEEVRRAGTAEPTTVDLVDVKGRKFPYDTSGGRHYWENWVTQEDLEGMVSWRRVFGEGYEPVFVFVYWLTDVGAKDPAAQIHLFRGEHYAFLWLSVEQYAGRATRRSQSWGTVSVSRPAFRELVHPLT